MPVSLFGRQGDGYCRFPFGKWHLLTWETENSKHSMCSYTCENRRGTTGISLQNSKQCLCLYIRAILLGKCPQPLNDFREIGYAPAELNINLSSESESGIFRLMAFRHIRFFLISIDCHLAKVNAHILYTKLCILAFIKPSSLSSTKNLTCIGRLRFLLSGITYPSDFRICSRITASCS